MMRAIAVLCKCLQTLIQKKRERLPNERNINTALNGCGRICHEIYQWQGSHSDWKTWKNGKAFSSQGKVREFWTDWKSRGKSHKILKILFDIFSDI